MALSLHAEYLLGYLAGAHGLTAPHVVPYAVQESEESPQARALLKALALGMYDGARDRPLRQPHEVRIHVLSMLTREAVPRQRGPSDDDPRPSQVGLERVVMEEAKHLK
jgi:hypothetical protein